MDDKKAAIKMFDATMKRSEGMNKEKSVEILDRYIRAREPIIGIVSHEEARVMDAIKAIAQTRKRKVVTWSMIQGLKEEAPDGQPVTYRFEDETANEFACLDAILRFQEKQGDAVLFVLKDIHGVLGNAGRGFDPRIVRFLREIAIRFETGMNNVILLSPALSVPPDLDKTMVVIDWPLPDEAELQYILSRCETELPSRIPVTLQNGSRERLVQSMMGLTAFEAGSVLMIAIAATGGLSEACIPVIVKEKSQIIKKSGVLEYYDTSVTMNQVGGLSYLKEYAAMKKKAFSDKAKAKGVDAPKGLILVGVPGTGKSLSAKAFAGGSMPLLRMDIGSLMGGLVGQSEANIAAALKVAEAVAPAILWVDEVEKALGGVESSNQSDGGTLARVFGTLLTWMQETTAPVYVIATANDVRALKPEFLRRFDDVMWVDLPTREARLEILTVHLSKRGYSMGNLAEKELTEILDATWGFSGAEIEKVVKAAVETAFFEEKELNGQHVLKAARRLVPISRTMGDKIDEHRNWANERAIQADEPFTEPRPIAKVSASTRMSDL
jgi:SpoVK/Ycf46/Vps4 family AAA+-type ATPase